jgi:hypothetical protein
MVPGSTEEEEYIRYLMEKYKDKKIIISREKDK